MFEEERKYIVRPTDYKFTSAEMQCTQSLGLLDVEAVQFALTRSEN